MLKDIMAIVGGSVFLIIAGICFMIIVDAFLVLPLYALVCALSSTISYSIGVNLILALILFGIQCIVRG